jgi:hypothetical protein
LETEQYRGKERDSKRRIFTAEDTENTEKEGKKERKKRLNTEVAEGPQRERRVGRSGWKRGRGERRKEKESIRRKNERKGLTQR